MRRVKVSTNDADRPEGRGLCGNAFRTRQPVSQRLSSRIPAGTRVSSAHPQLTARCPARRFRSGRGPAGRASCSSSLREEHVHARIRRLLERLAANVSFAMENFDRADEKARTENQKERLTRMFAALSATNEAIMRAKSRVELFQLVCEAAAKGGRFTSTTVALADRTAISCASWRPRVRRPRGPVTSGCRSARPPEGRGLSGTAFRTGGPASATTMSPISASPPFTPCPQRWRQVGCCISAVRPRQSRRRHDLHVGREGHVHARICRTAAAARRQRVVRAGEFRPRRRKDQGG